METPEEKKEAAKKQKRRKRGNKEGQQQPQEGEWEVVQEDAAPVPAAPEEAPRNAISARFTAEQDALWFGDDDDNANQNDIPEPSMENFFQDNNENEEEATPAAEDFFSEMGPSGAQESESLSLVPNKKAKTKKRKMRPSGGKRKKK